MINFAGVLINWIELGSFIRWVHFLLTARNVFPDLRVICLLRNKQGKKGDLPYRKH